MHPNFVKILGFSAAIFKIHGKLSSAPSWANSFSRSRPSVKSLNTMKAISLKSSSLGDMALQVQVTDLNWFHLSPYHSLNQSSSFIRARSTLLYPCHGIFWRAYVKSSNIEGAEALQRLRNRIFGWQTARTAMPFWYALTCAHLAWVVNWGSQSSWAVEKVIM